MMIAEDVGGGFLEEEDVQIAEGEEEPAEGDVGDAAEGFSTQPPGARFPFSTTMPASFFTGAFRLAITSAV